MEAINRLLHEILFARAHALAALSAAPLLAVGGDGGALHVAGVGHGDRRLLVYDKVFELNLLGLVLDDGAALVAVFLLHLLQLFDDDPAQLRLRIENGLILGDALPHLLQFVQNLVNGEARQAVQLQLEDGVSWRAVKGFSGLTVGALPVTLMAIFLPLK